MVDLFELYDDARTYGQSESYKTGSGFLQWVWICSCRIH